VITLFDTLSGDGIAVSIISYMETYQGVIAGGLSPEDQERFDAFFAVVPVLPLTPAIAVRCTHLRATLTKQGKRVRRRALDLFIAATALEHRLELVTRNTDDYRDIAELNRYRI